MINLDFDSELPGGRTIDKKYNLIYPWYTKSFLVELEKWDISKWYVFEYGSGDSTMWWRKKCKEVISVDTNKKWSEKTNSFYTDNKTEFIKYPINFIEKKKFDCIIIDGDPVEWRDDCTEFALQAIKSGGIIIIDNYNQKSVNLEKWLNTDRLLKDKEKKVYPQKGHRDWKTAYWVI